MGKFQASRLCVKTLLLQHWYFEGQMHVIRLQVIEGTNKGVQIVSHALHSFLVEVQQKLASHVLSMGNNNLEITITGSSCRPQ